MSDATLGSCRFDPNYYRLSYHLAAQRLNWFVDSGVGALQMVPVEFLSQGEALLEDLAQQAPEGMSELFAQMREAFAHIKRLDAAITGAQSLVDEATEAIALVSNKGQRRALPDRQPGTADERLVRFLRRTVEPCAQIVLASGQFYRGLAEEADVRVTALRGRADASYSYRVYYNLACYEVTRAAAEADTEAQEWRFARGLEDLRAALRKAVGQTEVELIQWAATDPSLRPLRESERHAEAFAALLEVYRLVSPTPQPVPAEDGAELPAEGQRGGAAAEGA